MGVTAVIKVDIEGARDFLDESELRGIDTLKAREELMTLNENGWINLPAEYNAKLAGEIKDIVAKISGESKALVVLGIGGSYLGARAAIEYVNSPNYNTLPKQSPDIYFAGNNASGEYLSQIFDLIGDRDFSVNVVSKSGSTIETAIALRFFKSMLKARYGAEGLKDRL